MKEYIIEEILRMKILSKKPAARILSELEQLSEVELLNEYYKVRSHYEYLTDED